MARDVYIACGCDVLFHIVVMHFSVYIVHSTVMNHAINMYTLSVLHFVVMQVVLLVYLML